MISYKCSLICHFSSTVHVRLAKGEKFDKGQWGQRCEDTDAPYTAGCRSPETAFLEGSLLQFVNLFDANTISFLGILQRTQKIYTKIYLKGAEHIIACNNNKNGYD